MEDVAHKILVMLVCLLILEGVGIHQHKLLILLESSIGNITVISINRTFIMVITLTNSILKCVSFSSSTFPSSIKWEVILN